MKTGDGLGCCKPTSIIDPAGLHPHLPRVDFDGACKLL
jgi:hypothetical protein